MLAGTSMREARSSPYLWVACASDNPLPLEVRLTLLLSVNGITVQMFVVDCVHQWFIC